MLVKYVSGRKLLNKEKLTNPLLAEPYLFWICINDKPQLMYRNKMRNPEKDIQTSYTHLQCKINQI